MKRLWIMLILLFTVSAQAQTPAHFNRWTMPGGETKLQLGMPPANYEDTIGTWAEIENDWIANGGGMLTNWRSVLKTTVAPTGECVITVTYNDVDYSITQELVGIGWLNTLTKDRQWIDNSMTWNTPSVDSNIISWTGISPGVNYRIRKNNGSVEHGIFLKPGFLDSAVTLYDLYGTVDFALANVMRYTISANIDNYDSLFSGIRKRNFKRIGGYMFHLNEQVLHYPGSDGDEPIPVYQHWIRQGNVLFCVEYVMMSEIKRIHELYPSATIWHNASSTLGGGTNDADCVPIKLASPNQNFSTDDENLSYKNAGGDDAERSLVKWDTLRTILNGQIVSACTLTLEHFYICTGATAENNVYGVKRAWIETEVEWDSAQVNPGGLDWATDGCWGATDKTTDSIAVFASGDSSGWHMYPLDITSYMQDYDNADTDSLQGFLITPSPDHANENCFNTASEDTKGGQQEPLIVVYYTAAGGAVYPMRRRNIVIKENN